MLNPIIEHNGSKYMSVKAAASIWDLSVSTIRKYCREKRINNCIKLNEKIWYIQIDEPKPLTKDEIHQLLVLTIQLKNDPTLDIDWNVINIEESAVRDIYNYLESMGYIKKFEIEETKRIPYDVILTNKGIDLATTFKKKESKDYNSVLTKWIPIIIQFGNLLISAKGLK